MTSAARRVAGGVTPVGRAVLALFVASLLVTRVAGLTEFEIIAWLCGLLLLTALPFVLVPWPTRGRLRLQPSHTVTGATGTGTLEVTATGILTIRRPLVDVPVGERVVTVRLPVLRPGVTEVTSFEVPAYRRGVLTVGPATARRTDPLGLYVRRTTWTTPVELLVRPRMVGLDALGAGFAQDLDGAPSDQVSMSDLAFHALREYVRGDDLRHVHWRSSARAGRLHVRQYHDSRRSRALVLVDDDPAAYLTADDLELALSVAASALLRLSQDDYDVSLVCGRLRVLSGSVDDVLDTLCRVEVATAGDLVGAAHAAAALVPDASLVVVVTGREGPATALPALRAAFPTEAGFLACLAGEATDPSGAIRGTLPVLEVQHLADLPAVLATHFRPGISA